jgi:hypothetical protein
VPADDSIVRKVGAPWPTELGLSVRCSALSRAGQVTMRANDSHSKDVIPQYPAVDPTSGDDPAERADEPRSADDGRSKQKASPNVDASLRPRALRMKDAARIYGLSVSTLNKLIKPGGGLRSVKIGGRRLIPRRRYGSADCWGRAAGSVRLSAIAFGRRSPRGQYRSSCTKRRYGGRAFGRFVSEPQCLRGTARIDEGCGRRCCALRDGFDAGMTTRLPLHTA